MQNIIISAPHKNFEKIKKIDENGVEFWEARELMPLLDYARWENFEKVIERAIQACKKSDQEPKYHFLDVTKMIKIAKGQSTEAFRQIKNYKLSRYACYLIAQNGDSSKQSIARAQTYFAIQTRKQEIFQQLDADEKRLFIRNEIKTNNKQLFQTAKNAGVFNFGQFNDSGYIGLYGMRVSQIKKRKQIGKGRHMLLKKTDKNFERMELEDRKNLPRINKTIKKIRTKS